MNSASSSAAIGTLPATVRVLERGWLSSNNVVMLDDEASGSVVDTGYCTHAPQTLALVQHALQGRRLARIVNTHLHSDHCGGNAALAAASGCGILIPPGHAAAVAAWDEDALSYRATGQSCPRFRATGVLQPGDVLRLGGLDWETVAGPGHDPHQVMLWCAARRLLISADVLWENGFGVLFPELDGDDGFEAQRDMLERVAALAPALVIPGHGAPFVAVAPALERAFARLSAMQADPARNARSIGRALLKFHLLEVRESTVAHLIARFGSTRVAERIRAGYFPNLSMAQLIESLVDDLVRLSVAARDGERVADC